MDPLCGKQLPQQACKPGLSVLRTAGLQGWPLPASGDVDLLLPEEVPPRSVPTGGLQPSSFWESALWIPPGRGHQYDQPPGKSLGTEPLTSHFTRVLTTHSGSNRHILGDAPGTGLLALVLEFLGNPLMHLSLCQPRSAPSHRHESQPTLS